MSIRRASEGIHMDQSQRNSDASLPNETHTEDKSTLLGTKRWTLADPAPEELLKPLEEKLGIGRTLTSILINRGIDTFEKAREFFRPGVDYMHDPYLMDGMDAAVRRILLARDKGDRVMVYGDYDVDGTNGTAMLYMYLKSLGLKVSYFIPDRIKDGYGLSISGIDKAVERGVNLLVSIDCGVTAIEQVDHANKHNIDCIICDHHEPGDSLPNAYAILNPLKPGCSYPFKHLSGCGVGFKLVQALARTLGHEEKALSYLDYVALASAADIVPLEGENRVVVKMGLDLINNNPRPGIRAIIESANLRPGTINTGQIVFVIAPRINAVGRLGDARRAVDLLTCDDYSQACEFAKIVESENYNRRKIDEETFSQAQEIAETYIEDMGEFLPLILHQDDWHPGVIGIVASRLVEKYYRPTILMTTVDGVAKGSARSIAGFDIYQALKQVEDFTLQFGGHKYAAGVSVDIDRLDEFRKAFNEVAREYLTEEILTPEIKIDALLTFDEITPKFVRVLDMFAPFGPENLNPTFYSNSMQIVGSPRIVGKNHLLMKVRQKDLVLDAIGFNLGHLLSSVNERGKEIQMVYTIHQNEWNGVVTTQLRIKDVKEQ
jgi:single-stranded-DNA-specific exonuclease